MADASPDHRAWLTLCGALGGLLCGVWLLDLAEPLTWRASDWPGRPWLFWTGALAYRSGALLLAGLAALVVLAVLGAYLGADRRACLAVLLAWPCGTAGLLAWPAVTTFDGMSGLQCTMLAVLGLHAARRAAGWLLLALLMARVLAEQAWREPIGFDPNWGANIVLAAHLSGALAGMAAAVALRVAGSGVRR